MPSLVDYWHSDFILYQHNASHQFVSARCKTFTAAKDAQIMSSMEECASSMGPASNYAAVKNVQSMLSKEECV